MQITKQSNASYAIYINHMYVGVVYMFEEDIDQCGITIQRDKLKNKCMLLISNRNWDLRAASVEYSKQSISFSSSFQ